MGSAPRDSRAARTRNACAVTNASSSASCGFATGTPSRPAVDVSPYPKSVRAEDGAPSASIARFRTSIVRRRHRAALRPKIADRKFTSTSAYHDQEVATADRLPEREPRLIQPGSARQVLRPELVDLLRGHGRRDVRIDELMQRVGEDDAPAPHRDHAERHDHVACEVQTRRLEVERDELDVAPRSPAREARRSGDPHRRRSIRTTSASVTTASTPKIEVAVREVVVDQLDLERDADPCRIRPGLREEPVVEPAAVADPSPGSVERDGRRDDDVDLARVDHLAVGGLHAPNDVSVTGSPGTKRVAQVALDDLRQRDPHARACSAAISGAVSGSEPNAQNAITVDARATSGSDMTRSAMRADRSSRSETGISSRVARTRRRTARFARLRSAPLIARSAPQR